MSLVLPEIPAAYAAGCPEQPGLHRLTLSHHAQAQAQAPVSLGTGYRAFGAIVMVVLLAAAVSTRRYGAKPRTVVAGHEDAA
ncbi:hypothetical protein [Aeromonas veronii]|uniref:hypothetical protein n=1 Tax=Aeromonas veronii TaxID=654 RepID=UPI0015BA0428|nr:hypothetical protein [Aeromonas veronii]